MKDPIRKALSRTVYVKGRGKKQIVVEPNEKLVLLVKFALGITFCLTGLEVASIIVLHSWSSEIFSSITGLVGTVTGILIGSKT